MQISRVHVPRIVLRAIHWWARIMLLVCCVPLVPLSLWCEWLERVASRTASLPTVDQHWKR